MKHLKLISSILAAGAAGVAVAKLGNAQFLAAVSGEASLAASLFLGILAFAAYDLARCIEPLKLEGALLRPTLPAGTRRQRTTAYGIRRQSAIVERAA